MQTFTGVLMYSTCHLLYLQWFFVNAIPFRDDVELSPRPNTSMFSFCSWNLNSTTAHDFFRVSLIEAYNRGGSRLEPLEHVFQSEIHTHEFSSSIYTSNNFFSSYSPPQLHILANLPLQPKYALWVNFG